MTPSAMRSLFAIFLSAMPALACADQFEEATKQAVAYLRGKLDDRLIPTHTKALRDSISRIEAQTEKVARIPGARPSESIAQTFLERLQNTERPVLDSCDSQQKTISERLLQAQRRELDLLKSYPAAVFSDVSQQSSYWKTRLRLESYRLLQSHVADATQYHFSGLDAYAATIRLARSAPASMLPEIEKQAYAVLDGIKAGCNEYAFAQELYSAVQRQ